MTADTCFSPGEQLLTADAARAALVAAAQPLTETQTVGLDNCLGRVLAESVVSPLDVPGYDNSAMDGYAVMSAEVNVLPITLPVSQRISAGHPGAKLQAGTCARIFTGAAMPEGADAVVMQERVTESDQGIVFSHTVEPGENVRPRANDIAAGKQVLEAGLRLRPAMIGLLASLGIDQVKVFRQLWVALLNTGDELVEPGQLLKPGQIYNSNRYALTAALQQAGCQVVDLGQVEDSLEATQHALRQASQTADLIVTSGGVSVGEEDHVKKAITLEGELSLWRVRMKPGKPLAFGQVAGTPLIGLPGNPVSALVTLCLFGLPFIRIAQGQSQAFPQAFKVLLDKAVDTPLKRTEFVRVRLQHQQNSLPVAEAFARQGSEVLTSTVWADGLMELPMDRQLASGSSLNYWSFEALLA